MAVGDGEADVLVADVQAEQAAAASGSFGLLQIEEQVPRPDVLHLCAAEMEIAAVSSLWHFVEHLVGAHSGSSALFGSDWHFSPFTFFIDGPTNLSSA